MARGCAIEFHRASKIYQRGNETIRALDEVDLMVSSGEFLSVMGASGSGKSTLLNLVAGLDRPTQGDVYIAGEPVSHWKDDQLTLFRREKVGFIFQFFNLLPTLTAEENAALPLLMKGVPKTEWKPKVEKWLERVGLLDRRSHYPSELSGGQMQRVAVIRALINDPVLILADEPTGNLDSRSGEEILFLLKGIIDEAGATMLLVTHDPKVAAYADRIITMKDGRILDGRG